MLKEVLYVLEWGWGTPEENMSSDKGGPEGHDSGNL